MGKMVYRQQGSSKDHSLFPIEFMDIVNILVEYPTIDSLILTGNDQGNSSFSWFAIFCSLNDIKVNFKQLKKEKKKQLFILLTKKSKYS